MLTLTLALQVASISLSPKVCGGIERSRLILLRSLGFFGYPWCAALFFAGMVDHRGRYSETSGIHLWTWRYAVTSFVGGLCHATSILHDCPPSEAVAGIAAVVSTLRILSWVVCTCIVLYMWPKYELI